MGKTGKWIRNFLLGKKEEKHKKIDTFLSENKGASMMESQMISPNMKRRWSFGRLRGGSGRKTNMVAGHKFSISFDSGDSAKFQIQALLESHDSKSLPTILSQVSRYRKDKSVAATKIQAAFRTYLARRALHALRGLVKLQALVRGYLVRKQTTATLRGMHALMAIQVRTRIHRIQMVEEANLLGKQPPQHREIPNNKGLKRKNKNSKGMSMDEMLEVLKNRNAPRDHSHVKSMEHDPMTSYSNSRSVSKHQHQYKKNTLITAPNSPENYRFMFEMNPTTIALSTSERHQVSHNQSWSPSYMSKTQSSKAKARSHSEPKQRPKKGMRHKSKSIEYTNELSTSLNGPRHSASSESSRFDQRSFDHWIINHYGSTKDGGRDSFGSTMVNSDSYY
ncbi:hypothetical protein Lal_00036404 [Lupinus albus]|uniref:Putative IQ motif, EF-hand binding, P-loop containing nucleoside triphosphate hydrolase n=1 Tax=Lupinus albus TaxID=3870 RepID=A0A6A5P4R0_LUPAL|nr:putative IQ motif, EF-hand binding, P-loop containing nucleoside triphosphate hydrolase [Lupinus albus]KAF1892051.1 hypothetical protein Lal_00036404 [Lupinus albus]